jgi:signal transduction histidine kinase
MEIIEAIKSRLLGLPILAKVMGIALGLAAVLCLAQFWQIGHSYFPLEEREVEADTSFLAQSLAAGAAPILRNGTLAELQQLLDEGTRISPAPNTSVQRVQVMNSSGQVLAQTSRPPVQDTKARVVERSAPLAAAQGETLSVMLNDRHVDYEVNWHKRRIVLTTVIITLLGLGATWLLMGLVTRPLFELGRTVREVKAGNYQARAPVRAKDEVGELAAAFNDMTVELQAKEAVNRQLLKRILAVGEEERKRVTHELNDQTAQALCSLVMGLEAVETGANQERLPELRALASETMRGLHDLSVALRPSALEEIGLAPALQTLCRRLAVRWGVKVDFVASALEWPARLPTEIEVSLFRIAEEAITAAVCHRQARSVALIIERKEASVLAIIEYDLVEPDAGDRPAQSQPLDDLDLLIIEERARLLNGSLRVESRPGASASLFIEIPLPAVGQPETEHKGNGAC